MIFAKLDVSFRDHEKLVTAIDRVGWGALGVYTWALMYLRGSESETGIISKEIVRLSMPKQRDTRRIIDALVSVGLWEAVPDDSGFHVCKYEQKNETKAEIDARRNETRRRVERHRNGVTNKNVTNVFPLFVPDSDSDSSSTSSSISPDSLTVPAESGPAVSQTGAETELTQEQRRELNMNRYVEAYEKAVIDAKGGTFTFPIGHRARSDLATVMNGHCKDSSGKRYKGDKTIEWISVHVFNFVRDVIDAGKTQYYSGFGPIGFAKYLNESFVKQEARAVP